MSADSCLYERTTVDNFYPHAMVKTGLCKTTETNIIWAETNFLN